MNDVINSPYIRASQVGVDPAYNHHTTSHPVPPHYTKEVSVDHSIQPDIFTDLQNLDSNNNNFQSQQPQSSIDSNNFGQKLLYWNDINNDNRDNNDSNEWECKIRVSKLLEILNFVLKSSDNNYLPYTNDV